MNWSAPEPQEAVVYLDAWAPDFFPRGTKRKALLRVTQRSDGTDLGIPLLLARGTKGDHALCAVAGIHGDEFEGGEAIRRFWTALDPATLSGVFVGVPMLNGAAFDSKHRASLFDHIPQDMARLFRPVERGYLSGIIAEAFFSQVVRHCVAAVDLHSGGVLLDITPCAIFFPVDAPGALTSSEELARRSGLPILRRSQAAGRGTLAEAASMAGVPAVTTEIGGEGRCRDEFVDLAHEVLSRIAAHVGLVTQPLPPPLAQPLIVDVQMVFSRSAGLFRSRVRLRQNVRTGEPLGTVVNAFGDTVERIVAPFDSLVVSHRTYPAIQPGELAFGLGRIVEG